MRKKIIAANWKMNLSFAEAMSIADTLVDAVDINDPVEVILGAPFVYLHDLIGRIQGHPLFSVAAQNCSSEDKGAFTGEISVFMLASIGVEHVIIGHSERRAIFGETDEIIASKINKAVEKNLIPIFCCGENLLQRKAGEHFKLVQAQLNKGLFQLDEKFFSECVIAYEPVWAIGTGITASPGEAQEMHSFIREKIKDKYGTEMAANTSILYGGSVTAKNAEDLFNCKDVDGGLVGGASLKADEFLSIVNSMSRIIKNSNN